MLEDEPRILNGAGNRALLGAVELFLPLIRVGVLLGQWLEALHRVVYGLLPQQGRRGAVVLGQGPHLLPAGEGRCGCARRGIGIQLTEEVDSHQIPGIQQLAACGVGAVVAVDEVAFVVKHRARRGAACGVGQAACACIHVHTGEKLLNRCGHVVSPAESAHHALFGGGIGLLAAGQLDRLSGAGGPLAHVVPVLVKPEGVVHADPVAVLGGLADPLAVAAAAGPVHQALGFKGGLVEHLHGGVEHLGHHPGAGLVLLWLHHAVGGEDGPQARVLRVVLPCGVDCSCAQGLDGSHPLLCAAGGAVVHVQRDQAAPGAAAAAAQAVPQAAAHKAAHVLALVLLCLGQGHVLGVGLSAGVVVHPGRQAFGEVLPGHKILRPAGCPSAAAHADLNWCSAHLSSSFSGP